MVKGRSWGADDGSPQVRYGTVLKFLSQEHVGDPNIPQTCLWTCPLDLHLCKCLPAASDLQANSKQLKPKNSRTV